MIRVCLADDQALFRSGVRALLALFDGISVVAEAEEGAAAVAKVLECRPDVLLLDVRMPRMNGVEVLSALARESALPPTLLLTTFEDDAAYAIPSRWFTEGWSVQEVAEVIIAQVRRGTKT